MCDLHRHTLTELFEIAKVNIINFEPIRAFISYPFIRKRQTYLKTALLTAPRIRMIDKVKI